MTDSIENGVPLVKGGQPAAVIVVGDEATADERLAAEELQSFIDKLARVRLEIVDPAEALATSDLGLLIVGHPDGNPLVERALQGQHDPRAMAPEGFLIHTGEQDGRPAAVVAGHDGVATLYAGYALLELLGATFLLTSDLLPEPVDDLCLPATNRIWEPAFSRRGLQIFPNDLQNVHWGLSYYKMLIDQMVKLRMNYLQFFVQAYQPWVDYTFRGEKNLFGDLSDIDSGYIVLKRSVPSCSVEEVEIGVEHFEGMRNLAPPEMQDIKTQEEATRRFTELIRAVLRYAKGRGMTVGFSLDPTYPAPNHVRFARKYGHRPHFPVYGAHCSPTDPVGLDLGEAWLKALLETYPEIDDMYLFIAECYDLCRHPDSVELYERMRPQFAEARKALVRSWLPSESGFFHGYSVDDLIDIQIGAMHHVGKLIEVAKRLAPDVQIGMSFFFKGYLLPTADKLVDRDIPFMDMQSSGVIPIQEGVNALYFAGMGERERYINPRIDDDGSMFGVPFYLRQFQHDGFFQDALRAGVSGFMGQMFRSRGTEHHTRFLAHGAWEPDLTPEEFYRRYSEEVFGLVAAGYMQAAFRVLENNEEHLAWRGMCNFSFDGGTGDLPRFGRTLLGQENPFDGPPDPEGIASDAREREELFAYSVELLEEALREMERARPLVSAKGESLLTYLISKTRAYIAHLQMTVLLDQGFAAYAQAFVEHTDDEPALARALDGAEQIFVAATRKARESAGRAAEIVDDPCDLGILFGANVWNVRKTDEMLQLIRRVVNYHHGRPYWEEGHPIRSQNLGDGSVPVDQE